MDEGPLRRVVLVEDDVPLSGLLLRYLKRLNFPAECFRRPEPALDSLRAAPARLLIADLTLGEESGVDLALAALELDPALPVLLMSGYPYEPDGFPPGARVAFMPKPFLPHMLQASIDRLLRVQDDVSASADSSLAAKLSPDSDHN